MTNEMSLDNLADERAVPPASFEDEPGRVSEIADVLLEVPSISEVLSASKSWGFYDRDRIEEALLGLAMGHVVLAGPPGTGKTKLAAHLAEAFGANLLRETANAEWSVYDVVGTLSIDDKGATTPRHGLFTNAVLQCAATVVRNLDTGERPQATWLLIDEINRAEIDRAFGALFTALSGEDKGSYTLDYVQSLPVLMLPRRFRVICTMNDYDTRFVNSMSSALRRRFGRILVVPPENDSDGKIPQAEFDAALRGGASIVEARLGKAKADTAIQQLRAQSDMLRLVFGAFREAGEAPGIPVGTAHVMDTCVFAAAFVALIETPADDAGWWRMLDRVVSTRLISGLESDTTRLRVDDNFLGHLEWALPGLPMSRERLASFLHGGR